MLPVKLDFNVRSSHSAVVEYSGREDRRHLFQSGFQYLATLLDRLQVGPRHLHTHRCTHAGREHHGTCFNGLQLRCRCQAGDMRYIDDLLPDVIFIPNFRTPLPEVITPSVGNQAIHGYEPEFLYRIIGCLVDQDKFSFPVDLETLPVTVFIQYIFGTVDDRVLEHLGWCRIECRIDPSPFADGRLHFRNMADSFVQYFNILLVLLNPRMGHAGWHQQEGSLVEAWHKLLSDSRKTVTGCLPETRLAESIPTHCFKTFCHNTECLVETHPDDQSKKYCCDGQCHELPPVGQAPTQNLFIIDHQQPEKRENERDNQDHEQQVAG